MPWRYSNDTGRQPGACVDADDITPAGDVAPGNSFRQSRDIECDSRWRKLQHIGDIDVASRAVARRTKAKTSREISPSLVASAIVLPRRRCPSCRQLYYFGVAPALWHRMLFHAFTARPIVAIIC